MRRVGIVGVGLLGGAVAGRLLDAGVEVRGYGPRREALEALTGRGLVAASSATAAATGVDAVFTILPTPAVVESAYLGLGGLLASMAPGAPLLQISTVSPALSRRRGEAAHARGHRSSTRRSAATARRSPRGRGPSSSPPPRPRPATAKTISPR